MQIVKDSRKLHMARCALQQLPEEGEERSDLTYFPAADKERKRDRFNCIKCIKEYRSITR